jgi:hypothetical protein
MRRYKEIRRLARATLIVVCWGKRSPGSFVEKQQRRLANESTSDSDYKREIKPSLAPTITSPRLPLELQGSDTHSSVSVLQTGSLSQLSNSERTWTISPSAPILTIHLGHKIRTLRVKPLR